MDQCHGSQQLIKCPEPSSSKKYKHINGLKYHQSHAHNNDEDVDGDDVEVADNTRRTDSPKPVLETPVDNKDLVKPSILRYTATRGNNPLLTANGTQIKHEPGATGMWSSNIASYYGQ